MRSRSRAWCQAWAESAYGPRGYWLTAQPTKHFRTSSATTPLLAEMIVTLLDAHPEIATVVEIGAGDGQLLAALGSRRAGLALAGIDIRRGPERLPDRGTWCRDLWDVRSGAWTTGEALAVLDTLDRPTLIICAEWLDDLPCGIAQAYRGVLRVVEVDDRGSERLGSPVDAGEAVWARRWWPGGQRVEIGATRDRAWAAALTSLSSYGGLGLMIDYGHVRAQRPAAGSLTAYRHGQRLDPRPCPGLNLTAHVAVDSVAEAGHRTGAATLLQRRQREVMAVLSAEVPVADPLADLVRRSERAALGNARVWGGQWWLLQQVHRTADRIPVVV